MHWCPAHCSHFILKFHFFNNRNLRRKHANEWTFYKRNCFEQLPTKSHKEHILDTNYSLPAKALCIADAPNYIRSLRHSQSRARIYIAYLQNHTCRNAGKNLMIFTNCTTPPLYFYRTAGHYNHRWEKTVKGRWTTEDADIQQHHPEYTRLPMLCSKHPNLTVKAWKHEEKWHWMNHNGHSPLKLPKE